ncbi:TatD family hydrolase, partial [Acinetobacter baumannii]
QADADPLIRPRSMFIDSHCHLSFPELKQRLPDILAEMRAAQVVQAICICTQMEEFEAVHALALEHPQLWSTVGVHPDTEGLREPD